MTFQVGDRVVAEAESTERRPRAAPFATSSVMIQRATGSSGTTGASRYTRRRRERSTPSAAAPERQAESCRAALGALTP